VTTVMVRKGLRFWCVFTKEGGLGRHIPDQIFKLKVASKTFQRPFGYVLVQNSTAAIKPARCSGVLLAIFFSYLSMGTVKAELRWRGSNHALGISEMSTSTAAIVKLRLVRR
jgi:hypothetical protein